MTAETGDRSLCGDGGGLPGRRWRRFAAEAAALKAECDEAAAERTAAAEPQAEESVLTAALRAQEMPDTIAAGSDTRMMHAFVEVMGGSTGSVTARVQALAEAVEDNRRSTKG